MAIQFLPQSEPEFPRNALLDFSPVNQGFDSLGQSMRYADQAQYSRAQDAKQEARASQSHAAGMADRKAALEQKALQNMAGVAQYIDQEQDPARRTQMWGKLVNSSPEIGPGLTKFGLDPGDHVRGPKFLLARAQGYKAPPTAMDQAELDYKRAQTAKLGREDGDTNTPQGRAAAAQQYGLDPNSDSGRSFILTGRLPREDQQSLTATDKKAILEADETVSSTDAAIQGLNRALELSGKAYDGATANERAWLTSQWGDPAGAATRELNQAVTTTALQQLKAIFGGNPTEGERKILLDIQGSAELPQNIRDNILKEGIRLAQKRLEFSKNRASDMRGGTFYKPGGGTGTGAAPAVPGGGFDLVTAFQRG